MRDDEYASHDALALAELIARKSVSPREVVDAAIARIERINPAINAVVHPMFEQGRRAAESLSCRGAFAGVPFLIKDLLTMYEGEPMSNGSAFYRGWRAPHDSEVMQRYRQSGVIVLGKTNTPEFGLNPVTEPKALGLTRNPWKLDRTSGGSSGGSAAAVASGMVPIAGGGDGGGSIRIPSACCGVFGLKPTRGRVPTGPDQGEIWGGAVVEGVISRSVRDSAAMLDALQGSDVGAPYVIPAPERPYREECALPPRRLKIAFTDSPGLGHGFHADCLAALRDAAHLLESLGHELVEAAPAIDRDQFNVEFLKLVAGGVAADLDDAAMLVGRKPRQSDVEITTWGLATLGQGLSAGEYASATRYLERAARGVGRFFEGIDLFLTPTLGSPPIPHGALQPKPHELVMMRMFGAMGAGRAMKFAGVVEQAAATIFDFLPYPPIFNVTGQPAMSVPLYWNAEGLPIGVHLAGRFGDEATLFRVAAQLEQARPWKDRRPPL